MEPAFNDVIATIEELREHYRQPSELVMKKIQTELNEPCVRFIGVSPFMLLATSHPDGRGDVSPRGGVPGFAKVLDSKRLVIPDLSGNNLIDSLSNVVETGRAALLFLVPGRDETLRVNGRAHVTNDPELLDLFAAEVRRPKMAIGIEVEEAFLHCGKAMRRSTLWDSDTWPDGVPTGGEILAAHGDGSVSVEKLDSFLEKNYRADLEAEQVSPT